MTLRDLLNIFKKFAFIIVAFTVFCGAMLGLYTHLVVGVSYKSVSKVQWVSGGKLETCIEYVTGDAILEKTVETVKDNYPLLTASNIKSMISVEKLGDSNVFEIAITNGDSGTAYYVCNKITENIPIVFETLGLKVKVVSTPSITPECTNDLVRNVVIGAILGMILSFVLAFVLFGMRKIVYSRSDVENCFDTKIIGAVPSKRNNGALKLLGVNALDSVFTDGNKKIAFTSVGSDKDKDVFVKVINFITGKSAKNPAKSANDLATAISMLGLKTLYIDAKNVSANSEELGLYECALKGGEPAIIQSETNQNLSLLSAGVKVQNTTELWASKKMKDLLDKISLGYDCVIIDMPSISKSADAVAVHNAVDGYVLGVNAGTDGISHVNNALGTLEQLSAKVFGLVLGNANKKDVFGGRVLERKN